MTGMLAFSPLFSEIPKRGGKPPCKSPRRWRVIAALRAGSQKLGEGNQVEKNWGWGVYILSSWMQLNTPLVIAAGPEKNNHRKVSPFAFFKLHQSFQSWGAVVSREKLANPFKIYRGILKEGDQKDQTSKVWSPVNWNNTTGKYFFRE